MPTQEELRALFDYKDGELINKERRNNRWQNKGKPIGSLGRDGYTRAYIGGKGYALHRLIWVWHGGALPHRMQIDHINGNRKDNRIQNLRVVSELENHHNHHRRTNSGGYFGVRKNTNCSTWSARIYDNWKIIYLGSYPTMELAIEARKKAERRLGYHENHGKYQSLDASRERVDNS